MTLKKHAHKKKRNRYVNEVKFDWPRRIGLHAGDWVVVRSQEEILSTLDDTARLD